MIEWRVIKDYPEYEVSNMGEVRRCVAGMGTRVGKVLRPRKNGNWGHWQVVLSRRGIRKAMLVHRLVASAFLGDTPTEKHEVAHYDGDPKNNKVGNLRWTTHADNEADKARHETAPVGSRNGRSKLTEKDIPVIRKLAKENTLKQMGNMYGLCGGTIWQIVQRKTWKHVL